MDLINKHLSGFEILDGKLIGNYSISINEHIPIIFDAEKSNAKIEDFSELLDEAGRLVNQLTEMTLDNLKMNIAVELTDAAYSESVNNTRAKDYSDLKAQLKLKNIIFYLDNVISMIFEAKEEYPDMFIYCQVDQGFDIEDLAVQ
ncbi:hypothetical protein [Pedobacter sp. D749]|uniref:hypothetical protein n=1 Tax=Pedobacter sp. D749 TaxID=2856523 RepID=UPI001C5A2BAF|nr:hypothetical protein [Pedobacter sp. D749]QXU41130.1 hypothetical protein KYH19_19340 [Pedobacter sp. D749]